MAATLAHRFQNLGVAASVLFIEEGGVLCGRLRAMNVPYSAVGLKRGRSVIPHARRAATVAAAVAPDAVILVECGYLGAALRAGGYPGIICAVEHGAVLFPPHSWGRRVGSWLSRYLGALADDVEVAVSDLVADSLRRRPHCSTVVRIHNGVDIDHFTIAPHLPDRSATTTVVGFAGRLVHGKGLDVALQALAIARAEADVRLVVAGDGTLRRHFEMYASALGLDSAVMFFGLIDDLPAFWSECDLALVPSNEWTESFGLSAVEAMACGRPVVAAANGALPELVVDGVSGTIVPVGQPKVTADALLTYAKAPNLRLAHGAAARARVCAAFTLDGCARSYLATIDRARLKRARSRPLPLRLLR